MSLTLKFGQLIHPSLDMKISIAKHLDTVQCLHPFTYELRVDGRVKVLGFWVFSCLVAEQQDYPLRRVMNKDPGNHLYQKNPVLLLLQGYPFKNRTTKG